MAESLRGLVSQVRENTRAVGGVTSTLELAAERTALAIAGRGSVAGSTGTRIRLRVRQRLKLQSALLSP